MTIYGNKMLVWRHLKYKEIYVFISQHDTEMVGYSTLCHTMMGWSTTVSGCVTLIKYYYYNIALVAVVEKYYIHIIVYGIKCYQHIVTIG